MQSNSMELLNTFPQPGRNPNIFLTYLSGIPTNLQLSQITSTKKLHQRLETCPPIRNLPFWNNKFLVSRGIT